MALRGEATSRLTSIDALRGVVMIFMALDHVRDFIHADAITFAPTDLSKTTPILFFTRWITHFCLPVFMFTAGMGIFLWQQRGGRTRGELSRFLLRRGVWFVLLELTVMQFAYNFNFSSRFLILLLILWIFGICMIAMAGLAWLRLSWLLAGSLIVIAFHNLLDPIAAQDFGSAAPLWNLFYQPGIFALHGEVFLVSYPLLPWIAVMASGFCLGQTFQWEPRRRQSLFRQLGLCLIAAFFVLRTVNRYGDPAPWTVQKSPLFTALSFLNCTKYPGSLDFLLMTIGPALLVLAYFDRHPPTIKSPFVVFGRVPLFYFVLHFYVIHATAVVLALLRYGTAALSFAFSPLPSMGGQKQLFPSNFGYSLPVTYLLWITIVGLLYPLCRWYAKFKATHRYWWLGYL